MTDSTNGADTREVCGVKLQRLSPSDWVKLDNHITITRRAKLLANIADAKVEPSEGLKQLNEFDSRPVTRGDIIDFAFLAPGVAEVFRLALAQANETDVDKIRLPQDEVTDTVMWLLHLKLRKAEPSPLMEAVGGTGSPTETGTTTPTPSV